ncbi:hypothetical protein HHI36_014516 [Cryptolaemus montrouzieri]|uniref:Telomerase reverse transcriptase n=1 Tax=Cryptolaemus montrouzieri TaxID=559131 RepID=A0ABD2N2Y4_9CUCU
MKNKYSGRYCLRLHSTHLEDAALLNWTVLSSNKIIQESLLPIRRRLKKDKSVIKEKREVVTILIKHISMDYFGSNRNKNLFIRLVKKILNHRRREFIHISLLSQGFENCFEWSKNIENDEVFQEVLKSSNIYLLEKCIKPFIEKHFFPLAQRRSHGIDLIPRPVWQKFKNSVFHQMKMKKHVELNEAYADMIPRGNLRLLPKDNFNSYRPLICFLKRNETAKALNYIEELKTKLKRYFNQERLHSKFFHQSWIEFINECEYKKIYGVKVDAEDSFGNVEIDKMCRIIQESPKECLSDQDKNYLVNRISNQYVSLISKEPKITVKWCHGLLQGDKLSSILCDLYYLFLVDKAELKNCMEGSYFFIELWMIISFVLQIKKMWNNFTRKFVM